MREIPPGSGSDAPSAVSNRPSLSRNLDPATVAGFGDEWRHYDQTELTGPELLRAFDRYFSIFPWDRVARDAVGFDAGCGTGRWARLVAPRVGILHCVDASAEALAVARRNLSDLRNCVFQLASVGEMPIADGSADFGYSLGVLHHVPETEEGIRSCAAKLKPGAPLLLYLYYAFDNRPPWFRILWRLSDGIRRIVCGLPLRWKLLLTRSIAATVYWPLARFSLVLEKMGIDVAAFPLSFYRHHSFYTMRTDALDRFGTRLEQRFTADQIRGMMTRAGLTEIRFSQSEPFWCAVGFRSVGKREPH